MHRIATLKGFRNYSTVSSLKKYRITRKQSRCSMCITQPWKIFWKTSARPIRTRGYSKSYGTGSTKSSEYLWQGSVRSYKKLNSFGLTHWSCRFWVRIAHRWGVRQTKSGAVKKMGLFTVQELSLRAVSTRHQCWQKTRRARLIWQERTRSLSSKLVRLQAFQKQPSPIISKTYRRLSHHSLDLCKVTESTVWF